SSMPLLFQPISINSLTLPNRFVRSATAERMAAADGSLLPEAAQLYERLARGGVGLIITGHASVSREGRAHPWMTGIHEDSHLPGLRRATKAVHRAKGKIAVQINHSGGLKEVDLDQSPPLAPSARLYEPTGREARELSEEEIERIIEDFGQAARRALAANFDAIQIHAAHGYLTNQFLSPLTNQRRDSWGGSLKNRMRFLLSAYRRVRKEVGPHYPLLCKLAISDFKEGGLSVKEGLQVAECLTQEGMDALEISGGLAGSRYVKGRADLEWMRKEGYFSPYTRQVKERVKVPVILVGMMRSLDFMERALAEGTADLVALCRPFIREPDLVRRLQEGLQPKSTCTSCNQCTGPSRSEPIACRVSPGGSSSL
ncbi:MAG: NADH:flavin oxidoreductase, partial [candidate division NC10 bacterium]|nr:NADH:flavin oxidoreductase [candidate division NC10 bacterium]